MVVSVPPLSAGSFAASEEIERLAKNSNSSISSSSLPKPHQTAENQKRQNSAFLDWTQNRNVKDQDAQEARVDISSDNLSEPLSREEFDVLIEAHRQQIVLYLISMVQNITDAEDLCQKCCVIMWQKSSEYDRRKSFLPWACGIARLESYNYRRSRSTERLQFGSDVLNLLATSLEEIGNSNQDQRLSALKNVSRLCRNWSSRSSDGFTGKGILSSRLPVIWGVHPGRFITGCICCVVVFGVVSLESCRREIEVLC